MEKPTFVYTTYIKTTPERLWQALTEPAFTERYWRTAFETDWQVGSPMTWHTHGVTIADPEQVVLEADPYRRLSYTWHTFTPELAEVHDLGDEVLAEASRRSPIEGQLRDRAGWRALQAHGRPRRLRAGEHRLRLISGGWPRVLSDLKTLLETDAPPPSAVMTKTRHDGAEK